MSAIQLLRAFVSQRLTVAVEEIMGVFERTITEYEEEIDRQRRLLGAEPRNRSPVGGHTGVSEDVQPLSVNTKTLHEHQDLSVDLELSRLKEEPEDMWTSHEAQHFDDSEGTDLSDFQIRPISIKTEEDDEETCCSSQLAQSRTEENTEGDPSAAAQQTEVCEASEPTFDLDVAGFLKASSSGQFFLSQCFKSENEASDEDWNHVVRFQPQSHTEATPHKRLHQKKLHKCPMCSKTFNHNTALQRHITCHTGERPFDCTECGKAFRQKGSLHIHMRKHTGEKPFSCLVCGKNFTQSGTLAAHMRIHTGEKPFSCSVCQNRYNERGTLVRHMRVHTGEKPFSCSLCGKRFSEKGNLNKHKRIHTGEKPFSCNVCEKKFSLLSHLNHHKCPGERSSSAVAQLSCPQVTVQLTSNVV